MSGRSFDVVQEPDAPPCGHALSILALAVVVVVTAIGVSADMLRRRTAELPPEPPPAEAPDEIGLVEQTLIEESERGVALRAEEARRLASYAWVDEARGVASIPIEAAMRVVLERGR